MLTYIYKLSSNNNFNMITGFTLDFENHTQARNYAQQLADEHQCGVQFYEFGRKHYTRQERSPRK